MTISKKGKNETEKDYILRRYIELNFKFSHRWEQKKSNNNFVNSALSKASKKDTGKRGEPDFIYVNETDKLLILIENKDSINDHESKSIDNPVKYAVDGIRWYLSFFKKSKINKNQHPSISNYFKGWKIIGLAVSGNIEDSYNHRVSTFRLDNDDIVDCRKNEILDESAYLSIFMNAKNEKLAEQVSRSSIIINKKLRDIDSQKRPILLSALMICLYDPKHENDFKATYKNLNPDSIADHIPSSIKKILSKEHLPSEKIDVLINELAFLKTDITLRNSDILKEILLELEDNVISLFDVKSNYDIVGKFYEEFLRFAGITNVKKGIVLTPHHIAELFTELIPLKEDDCIIDCCCGTGAFLISAMTRILSLIDKTPYINTNDKEDRKTRVKESQLIGFESNSMMYTLAISNMLFRGDGKSHIYHEDCFSVNAKQILESLKKEGINPTIGFINPPYGGKDNTDNPTKKEIQFIEYILDNVSRYGVVIAPLSAYFNDDDIRNRILQKHTLKYVINMPKELFMPNAATNTAIAVFETKIPHNGKDVLFCELKDDGLVLSKNRGRTDLLNKWETKKKYLLDTINGKNPTDGRFIVRESIQPDDEWLLQAHSSINYDKINETTFINSIKNHLVFTLKDKLNILNTEINEIDIYELIGKNIKKDSVNTSLNTILLNTDTWKDFKLGINRKDYKKLHKAKKNKVLFENLFIFDKGERIVEYSRISGDTPLITASSYNNGRTSMIDREDGIERKKKLYHDKITIDMFCNVYFHPYEYFSDDNVHTLSFVNPEYEPYLLNPYINIFLITILSLFKDKFEFGRQVRLKRLEKLHIKLPVDEVGNPNWIFMENYIKSLPYSSSI